MSALWRRFRQELKLNKIFLPVRDEREFITTQWPVPHVLYVAFRCLVAGYAVYALAALVYDNKDNGGLPMMVFFTVWSYILLTVHLNVAAILAVLFFKKGNEQLGLPLPESLAGFDNPLMERDPVEMPPMTQSPKNGLPSPGPEQNSNNPAIISPTQQQENQRGNILEDFSVRITEPRISVASISSGLNDLLQSQSSYESFQLKSLDSEEESVKCYHWFFKLSWILANMVSGSAPVVTVIFFTVIYPSLDLDDETVSEQDVNVHALNLVFVIIDNVICGRPVRLLHVVHPALYGLCYVIFSVIYWSSDHKNHVVYEGFLDWNHPGTSTGAVLALAFLGIPSIQLFFWGLFLIKLYLCRKWLFRKMVHP